MFENLNISKRDVALVVGGMAVGAVACYGINRYLANGSDNKTLAGTKKTLEQFENNRASASKLPVNDTPTPSPKVMPTQPVVEPVTVEVEECVEEWSHVGQFDVQDTTYALGKTYGMRLSDGLEQPLKFLDIRIKGEEAEVLAKYSGAYVLLHANEHFGLSELMTLLTTDEEEARNAFSFPRE